ncbi:hypothetical protein C2S51_003409 [Perilla frutescens var. frutescens]|nr:hypothetical protein C2S51_003409 [Perilla frutescens var. frutescens]
MEESSTAQKMTPRKRGRPRKIVEKIEAAQEEEEDDDDEETAKEIQDFKKSKISEGGAEEKVGEMEGKSQDKEIDKEQQLSPRSRARKKSKPRKST